MKIRFLLALVAALSLAMVAVAGADTPRDSARGGGQVLLDPDNPPTTGALDTLAFQAQREQGTADEDGFADGQVQVNRRSGEAGTQIKFHGVVECLIVVGNKAYISGVRKGTEIPFELFVQDGGVPGDEGAGGDQAFVWYGPETEENDPDQQIIGNFTPPQEDEYCGIEEDPSSKREIPAVARGNYKVNDYTAPSARKARTTKSVLALR